MSFDVKNLGQRNKKGNTLQANQLKYIEDVLGCFCDLAVAKNAVKDIQLLEKFKKTPTVMLGPDIWYSISIVEGGDKQNKVMKKITIGQEDKGNHIVGVKKGKGNNIVGANEDMNLGKTCIGVKPRTKVKTIADSYIKEYTNSQYESEIRDYRYAGYREVEVDIKDPNSTRLIYTTYNYGQGFVCAEDIITRKVSGNGKGYILEDGRAVCKNKHIVEKRNSIAKKDNNGGIYYSVEKKGGYLELNILIPPEEEMGNYIERSEKIESTK